MKTTYEYITNNLGIEIPRRNINGAWFAEKGLPMIVGCRCCGATMCLLGSFIDEDEYIYCADCAGVE